MKKNRSDQTKFFALHPSAKPVCRRGRRGGLRRVTTRVLPISTLVSLVRNLGRSKFCLVTSVNGSSLLETLIYAAILGMVVVFTTSSILAMMKSYSSVKLSRDINSSASVAMERMANEIRLANDIDDIGSIFGVSPGELKLNTIDSLGVPATVEFFLSGLPASEAGTGVFVKEGADVPEALTASTTEIISLVFNKITSSTVSKAVKISLTVKAKGSRMEKTEKFYNTVILRGSY